MAGRKEAAALLVLCAACAPAIEPGAQVEVRELRREAAPAGASEVIESSGVVRAFGVVQGALIWGLPDGVALQRASDPPQPVAPRVLREGEPEQTGAVRAIAARPGGDLLVAAANGLFVWHGGELVRSPLSDVVGSPELVAAVDTGLGERVAVAQGARLVVLDDLTRQLEPRPTSAAPDSIALAGDDLFAAWGEQILRLRPVDGGFEQALFEPEAGRVRAMATDADGALWVAAERAVLRRTAVGTRVTWTLWNVEGGAWSLAPDPDGAGIWARTKNGALRIGDGDRALEVPLDGEPGAIAMDGEGQLWAADGKAARVIRRAGLEAPPPSFAQDVQPFAQMHCIACHSAGTTLPLTTFDEWQRNSQRILLNLQFGTMPQDNPLAPSDYRVVERWIRGGMLP